MKKKFRLLRSWAVILLCGFGLCLTACGSGGGKSNIGAVVQDFRLDTLEHERFYLNQHKGKVVVLVFWATWCRSCKTEMVELQAAFKTPAWKDVVVAAVNTDPENLSDVKSIVQALGIAYPVLLDREARLFDRFGIPALPTTLIIDPEQRLSFFRVGYDRGILTQLETKIANLKNKSF